MVENLYHSLFSHVAVANETVFPKLAISLLILFAFLVFAIFFKKNSILFIKKIVKIKNAQFEKAFAASIAKPVSILLIVVGVHLALLYIPLNFKITAWLYPLLNKIFRLSIMLVVSLSLQNYVGNITIFVKSLNEHKNKTVISFVSKLGKMFIIFFTVVILLKELGYDVNGLIAGLGLGGLTFALAAQDTASNFFSGVIILLDKPFAVGDWIAVADIEGVVEEMNFRSCRVRTFDNALISVPNSKLSSDSVTNWTKMNLRKTKFVIGVVYTTPKDVLQKICDEIKAHLIEYPEIKKDTVLVWFDKFNTSSLDIVVQFHSFPIPLSEHTLLKQEVNYMVMDIISKNNSHFAYPTTTIITGG